MTITRRDFLGGASAAVAAGVLGPVELFARQAAAAGSYTPIRRNVGTWVARGGTIGWLVNPAGAVAVDSQFPESAAAIVERLLAESKQSQITALINTHHHGDHTAGNGVFRPKTRQIIGHANVPGYMRATWQRAVEQRAANATSPAPPEPVVPDRTFTDVWAFSHGDEEVSIKHYGPAHTGGDAVIRFERANVAHMGDLMFNRAHPVIDRANGASIANWSRVLRTVASELPAETIYIFGHAGAGFPITGTHADLRYHANYLEALLAWTRAQVAAGRSRETVLASTDVLKGFEDYGPLIARPLGAAYDEVTAGGQE